MQARDEKQGRERLIVAVGEILAVARAYYWRDEHDPSRYAGLQRVKKRLFS